jgi:hypothetical protein
MSTIPSIPQSLRASLQHETYDYAWYKYTPLSCASHPSFQTSTIQHITTLLHLLSCSTKAFKMHLLSSILLGLSALANIHAFKIILYNGVECNDFDGRATDSLDHDKCYTYLAGYAGSAIIQREEGDGVNDGLYCPPSRVDFNN